MFNPRKEIDFMEPTGACFPHARLSEAWTPYQMIGMIFDPPIGLFHGTIFPELVRPYMPNPNAPEWY